MNPLAIELCKKIEHIIAPLGMHVALTGGTLYKDGDRKDIDLVLYMVRQRPPRDNIYTIMQTLQNCIKDFTFTAYHGFVSKATYRLHNIDILYPEYTGQDEDYED